MPRKYPAELRRRTCERMLASEGSRTSWQSSASPSTPCTPVAAPGPDRRAQSPGPKPNEADPLEAARRPIKELEAELKLVKAGSALLEEAGASPNGSTGCPRADQPGLLVAPGLPGVGLDRSTYYGIKFHQPSHGKIRRLLLAGAIADVHARSRGTYGMCARERPWRSKKALSSTRSW